MLFRDTSHTISTFDLLTICTVHTVIFINVAETDELIEMLFLVWTRGDQRTAY